MKSCFAASQPSLALAFQNIELEIYYLAGKATRYRVTLIFLRKYALVEN